LTPCGLVDRHCHFVETYPLFTVIMLLSWSSRQQISPKRWYLYIKLHSFTSRGLSNRIEQGAVC
jgi:hypothetical protein